MSAGAGTSAISRFPVKSSSHAGIPSVSSLLRVFGGSNEIERSCGGDVEEEVVVELDDSPGTTNRTKFSVLQKV